MRCTGRHCNHDPQCYTGGLPVPHYVDQFPIDYWQQRFAPPPLYTLEVTCKGIPADFQLPGRVVRRG